MTEQEKTVAGKALASAIGTIIEGDNLAVMAAWPDSSFDAIVTDPPYGLKFMGKRWDHGVPGVPFWCEFLRVLKPGGHLLAFGGTRTHHRVMCALEDAGFEIRDCLMWLYGSGFPKSLDVSKAIDKAAGAKREIVSTEKSRRRMADPHAGTAYTSTQAGDTRKTDADGYIIRPVTAPATPDAEQWQGWGTGLKPAWEPVILARKPLSEKNVAANVLKWGTGALNVDGCKIAGADSRWPANLILDEEAGALLDKQSGERPGEHRQRRHTPVRSNYFGSDKSGDVSEAYADSGGASRFFYCAKASRRERGKGNTHPTVKPLQLMAYLCRLVTPPGGMILDPFAGSGSTCIAARAEGFSYVGIELDGESVAIAQARLAGEPPTAPEDPSGPGPLFSWRSDLAGPDDPAP